MHIYTYIHTHIHHRLMTILLQPNVGRGVKTRINISFKSQICSRDFAVLWSTLKLYYICITIFNNWLIFPNHCDLLLDFAWLGTFWWQWHKSLCSISDTYLSMSSLSYSSWVSGRSATWLTVSLPLKYK